MAKAKSKSVNFLTIQIPAHEMNLESEEVQGAMCNWFDAHDFPAKWRLAGIDSDYVVGAGTEDMRQMFVSRMLEVEFKFLSAEQQVDMVRKMRDLSPVWTQRSLKAGHTLLIEHWSEIASKILEEELAMLDAQEEAPPKKTPAKKMPKATNRRKTTPAKKAVVAVKSKSGK